MTKTLSQPLISEEKHGFTANNNTIKMTSFCMILDNWIKISLQNIGNNLFNHQFLNLFPIVPIRLGVILILITASRQDF